MHISVKLFATLQKDRFKSKELDIPEKTTAGEVIGSIGIPVGEVTLVFVNGRHSRPETLLQDGDVLALFPPIGGG